jgi:hypothetical protein
MGTIAGFVANTGAGTLMFGFLKECVINGCILPIYTGTNVQVYVNGTIRRDWFKDDIDTGNSFPLQFGRWTEEDKD